MASARRLEGAYLPAFARTAFTISGREPQRDHPCDTRPEENR